MYAGPMFRAENVQKGRQRQFNQVGIECLGSEDPSIDAEAIIMLMRFYEAIGLDTSKLTLLINSMGCETCRPAYRDAVAQFLIDHEADLARNVALVRTPTPCAHSTANRKPVFKL